MSEPTTLDGPRKKTELDRHYETALAQVAALAAALAEAQRERDEARDLANSRPTMQAYRDVLERAEGFRERAIAAQAEATALREALAQALSLAKVATNTWACVARSKRDHDVIGGLHRDIDAMRDKWALGGQPPTGGQAGSAPTPEAQS